MVEVMGLLTEVTSRPWHIQACSAKTGEGLDDGLEWLIGEVNKSSEEKACTA